MSRPGPDTEWQLEQTVGNLLRVGVAASALVVLAGAVLYLCRHGTEAAENHVFRGEPVELRSPKGIVSAAWTGSERGIIQLGLLLLIATPVARVVFSVYAFFRLRDRLYVLTTLFVLGVLLLSLFSAHLGG